MRRKEGALSNNYSINRFILCYAYSSTLFILVTDDLCCESVIYCDASTSIHCIAVVAEARVTGNGK